MNILGVLGVFIRGLGKIMSLIRNEYSKSITPPTNFYGNSLKYSFSHRSRSLLIWGKMAIGAFSTQIMHDLYLFMEELKREGVFKKLEEGSLGTMNLVESSVTVIMIDLDVSCLSKINAHLTVRLWRKDNEKMHEISNCTVNLTSICIWGHT